MQGRLVKSEKKILFKFPWKIEKRISYCKRNKIKLMEWTIDYFKFKYNPLVNEKCINQIKKLKKK